MQLRSYVIAALLAALPSATAAQENWVSAFGGLVMDPATVVDGESAAEWDFGTSVAFGASVQRLFGQALIAGVEVAYSPMRHEVRDTATDALLHDGRAQVLTVMATGRLGAGGGGSFFTYLTGGLGSVVYGIPGLERWDPDLAFRAGGGIEYRYSQPIAFFVEWNRYWIFHQTEGVDDNTGRHSGLAVGARYGF